MFFELKDVLVLIDAFVFLYFPSSLSISLSYSLSPSSFLSLPPDTPIFFMRRRLDELNAQLSTNDTTRILGMYRLNVPGWRARVKIL